MHVVLANMASYTFGREAFVAAEAEAEVHLCFVAEAECGPKPHFERHSAPEPNFGRSLILLAVLYRTLAKARGV